LPMQDYEPWLRKYILEGHKEWKANVYGQCKSWLDTGLRSRAMTRDLGWGIPVPVAGAEGKVLYVWFDAPIGYISATKEWAEKKGTDWEPYWKDEETRLIHFIGKDNIVFHCIIFPSILKADGSFILPDNVPANEFLNLEGDKISTSRNWAVWLHEFLEELPGKEDVLRYVLCANAPETKDNDFTWKDFQARNNNELVAIYGNFVNRALVLTHKYFDGELPEAGELFDAEKEITGRLKATPEKIAEALESFKFRDALSEFMDLARAGNKYLADTEPWKLIKTDPERVKTILNLALQVVANLSLVGEPFLPNTSVKLKSILNFEESGWEKAGSDHLLSAGHSINKPELLFEKIEDTVIERQIEKLEKTKLENEATNNKVAPAKEVISYNDFVKMDMRISTILDAEAVPKSKKLLKLTVDTGIDTRTILSGIAQHFSVEEVMGKQVCVLVNLAPRKMMGIESEGMVLMAENSDGSLKFIAPPVAIDNGSTVS
ncbi:MAG: methionine--tRNA ligase subunit beta, partial [Bacteroidota bacterium]